MYVITHPNHGILIFALPLLIAPFTKDPDVPQTVDSVQGYLDRDIALEVSKLLPSEGNTNPYRVVPVDVDPGATSVSFSALRRQGFGHLLPDELARPSLPSTGLSISP
jgi:hypothetical protein